MLRVTALSILVFVSCIVKGQTEISGKWYFFSRNRMIELSFSNDRIISRQLNWSLSAWNPDDKPDTQFVSRIIEANRNIYLITINQTDSLKRFRLETYRVVKPGKEMMLVVNAPDTLYNDIAKIETYMKNDIGPKYGIPLFSEAEIKRFQTYKNLDSMSVPDFKVYISKIVENGKMIDSISKMGASDNNLLYYGYAMARSFLAYMGYNPLVSSGKFDAFFKRFEKNPATKDDFKRLQGDQ